MDELIDIVTHKGEPTGKTCLKSAAHRHGILHASVHVWFYTKKGQILIQKRSPQKDIFPNLWDVSVAGHVGASELPSICAVREIKEEIGHQIVKNQLEYLGIWEEKHTHANGFIDYEIHHIYLSEINITLEKLTPQKEEVSDLAFVSLSDFKTQCQNPHVFVPHDIGYYTYIQQQITERITYEK